MFPGAVVFDWWRLKRSQQGWAHAGLTLRLCGWTWKMGDGLCPHLPWRRGACSGASTSRRFVRWMIFPYLKHGDCNRGFEILWEGKGISYSTWYVSRNSISKVFPFTASNDECWQQKLLSLIVSPDRDPWQGFWSFLELSRKVGGNRWKV